MPMLLLGPVPLWCSGLGCPWKLRTIAAGCLLRAVRERSDSAVAPVVGGHTDLVVWRVVVLAFMCVMEQGRPILWSLACAPPRQGSAVRGGGHAKRFHLLLVCLG
jgi:hypothetical protein